MKKSGKTIVIISILVSLILIFGGITAYFLFSEKHTTKLSSGKTLVNPAKGLSLEEAIKKFDDKFVYYLLVSIKAYTLHNPLLSSDLPKIEIQVDEDVYYAKVSGGKINVRNGFIEDKDIIIKTTKEEAVKMIQNKNYVTESFKNGYSSVELVSNRLELYSKGYLDLYDELSGDDK